MYPLASWFVQHASYFINANDDTSSWGLTQSLCFSALYVLKFTFLQSNAWLVYCKRIAYINNSLWWHVASRYSCLMLLHLKHILHSFQVTVVPLFPPTMDLWRATATQQRVQRCSTAVTQVIFQMEGWELCALRMSGIPTLLIWVVQLVWCSDWST